MCEGNYFHPRGSYRQLITVVTVRVATDIKLILGLPPLGIKSRNPQTGECPMRPIDML